jgi:hypothetical protein
LGWLLEPLLGHEVLVAGLGVADVDVGPMVVLLVGQALMAKMRGV